ncbi:MAG TPA: hypothetical protein DC058_20615 [Planctomycetaceae bacterium]|nr:hypothetical protein [Planctomycetaceae bacterium]HBC63602.1 hypothetical protein [Planctomycetaceae bacterium]
MSETVILRDPMTGCAVCELPDGENCRFSRPAGGRVRCREFERLKNRGMRPEDGCCCFRNLTMLRSASVVFQRCFPD